MPWFPCNQYFWDFWFARRRQAGRDELHVFYLQAGQRESQWNPDLRHDLASVGHAVMTCAGWRELTPALSSSEGRAWDNRSIWTGCVIENPDDGLYYMFYTARRNEDATIWTPSEWQRPQQIGLAVSPDLIKWDRTETSHSVPVIPNPGRMVGLDGVAWRDPYVIRGEDGAWQAFICARVNPADADHKHFGTDAGGTIVWLQSDNPETWNVAETRTLIASDEFYQMEVPQIFWRTEKKGKRFYLIFCAQEKDCSRARRARQRTCGTGTFYLSSELLPFDYAGIPQLNEPAQLLAPGWYSGKLLDPETVEQPLFFGFQWADEAGRFVGGLSDGLLVRFNHDGTMELKG